MSVDSTSASEYGLSNPRTNQKNMCLQDQKSFSFLWTSVVIAFLESFQHHLMEIRRFIYPGYEGSKAAVHSSHKINHKSFKVNFQWVSQVLCCVCLLQGTGFDKPNVVQNSRQIHAGYIGCSLCAHILLLMLLLSVWVAISYLDLESSSQFFLEYHSDVLLAHRPTNRNI